MNATPLPRQPEPRPPYWAEKLAGRPPALELPTSRARPAQPSTRRSRVAFRLPQELARSLRGFARAEGAALFDAVVALLSAALYRTTRQADLLVGLREGDAHAALRFSFDGRPSFRAHLAHTLHELAEARSHALPLPELVRAAKCTRVEALFQVLLTSERLEADEARGYDLVLSVAASSRGALSGALFYDAELFDSRVVERFLGHVETLLGAALAQPDQELGRLAFLTEAERRTLLHEWNDSAQDFPRELCLHQLFEQRVAKCPDAPAVVHEGRHLTYAALEARSNRLARQLRSIGVGPDVVVALSVERSFELVVGLLAIAKAGGAYLPMDPAYPEERLAFMLADSGAGVLLTQRHLLARLPEPSAAVRLVLLDDERRFAHLDGHAPESGVGPENLAYVIYTSGSTGKPKGVVLDHRGRVNNFLDFNRRFAVGTGDALIALSSLSFDMCAYDVFGTLAAGATLVLPRSDELKDPRAWGRLMNEQHVTIWHTAPALLRMLVDQAEREPELVPRALRLALLGGDWIPVSLPNRLRALVPEARVVSMGGATECSMDSTIYEIDEVDPAWRSIPYGEPMANQRAYVLDEDLQPVPALVPGELYLGGIGVARGYWNRPELTRERFLRDPFSPEPDARMYRTGDLARWMEDGNLELLGRVDNQVKIRGLRIELGEIEAELVAHPAVREGVVTARADASGEKRLVAYYVERAAEPQGAGAARSSAALATELRAHLASELPPYMVPVLYVRLDELPLSPNGKVDRKRLPEPERGRPQHLPEFVPPRGALEELVAAIWADVLRLETVGAEDPFLDLGGHSISAAQVQARLCELLPFDVGLRELFEASTVAALARHLSVLARSAGADLEQVCRAWSELSELSDDDVARRLASNS